MTGEPRNGSPPNNFNKGEGNSEGNSDKCSVPAKRGYNFTLWIL